MQVAVMAMLLIVGVFGTEFYQPLVPFFLAISIIFGLGICFMYARSVYKMVNENKSVHPVPTYFDAVKQVLPYCGWLATTLLWFATTRDTVEQYPTWHLLAVTLAFGAMTQQLIAQRICSEPIKFNYYIMIPYGVAALFGVLKFIGIASSIDGFFILVFVFVSSFLFEALFVNSIIHQLSTFLEIRPFVIVPKQPKPAQDQTPPPQTPPAEEASN